MKKGIVFVLLAFVGLVAFAANFDSSPFGPELSAMLNQIDPLQDNVDGNKVMKVARAVYDVAEHGGGTGTAFGLGVYLPKNAVLVKSWFHILTQFVDAGSGTVALHCEDAGNIFTAADITGSGPGVILNGNQTGGISSMGTGIADRCEIKATVATAPQTAGKLLLFVQYMVLE